MIVYKNEKYLEVGDIFYNKSRHGFMQVKEVINNKVLMSKPCSFYNDAKTTITRITLPIKAVITMELCTLDTLPNQEFAYLKDLGVYPCWRSKVQNTIPY